MIRSLFLAIALYIGASESASAYTHGVDQGAQPGPQLQATALNVGNLTRTSKASERLSNMHFTTLASQPVTFGGVDLWTGLGTTPASWMVTFVSGRSSTDFTLPAANVAEGASAIIPVVSSTGQNNITGDYTFNVTAKDAGGFSSNTAVLTIHVVNPTGGGCVSLGDTDSSGYIPAAFGTSANQCILFATGFNKMSARYILNITNGFTQNVILTHADITRPAALSNIQLSTTSNIEADDLIVSGDVPGGTTCMMCIGTSGAAYTNAKYVRPIGRYSPTQIGVNTGLYVYNSSGCTSGCEMDDGDFDYLWTGTTPTSNSVMRRTTFRHFTNNCVFIGGNTSWMLEDVKCMSPYILGNEHGDCFQYADSGWPMNGTLTRFACVQADGSSGAQGPIFAGPVLGTFGEAGYIDDGTVGHGPGKKITLTMGHWHSNAVNGAQLFSPGNFTTADNYTVASGAIINGTTAVMNIPAGNVNIGSPASPVLFFTYANNNFAANGIIYTGTSSTGSALATEQATSFLKNFDYIKHSVSGVTLLNQPSIISGDCDISNLHGGTYTISSGFTGGGLGTRQGSSSAACPGNTPPANTTVAASWDQAGCASSGPCAAADAAFKYGNPETNLEAISQAAWAAMSNAVVFGTIAHYLIPKASGPLDAGGGVWYGAVKDDGSGHCVWNDGSGTVIQSCTP